MVLNSRCSKCGSWLYIPAPCEICEWEKIFAAAHKK